MRKNNRQIQLFWSLSKENLHILLMRPTARNKIKFKAIRKDLSEPPWSRICKNRSYNTTCSA